jgi:hypothetical protein
LLTFSSRSRSASLIFTVVNLLIFGSPPAIDTSIVEDVVERGVLIQSEQGVLKKSDCPVLIVPDWGVLTEPEWGVLGKSDYPVLITPEYSQYRSKSKRRSSSSIGVFKKRGALSVLLKDRSEGVLAFPLVRELLFDTIIIINIAVMIKAIDIRYSLFEHIYKW